MVVEDGGIHATTGHVRIDFGRSKGEEVMVIQQD